MYRRNFAIVISVLALVGTAWGCGGDDDGESLTKAEFIEQADAACQEANTVGQKKLVAFLQKNSQDNKLSKANKEEAIETIIVPLIDAQLEGLTEHEPPEGDEKQVEAVITSLEDLQDEAEADPAGTAKTYAPFSEPKKLAREYGFKTCGANN